MAWPPSLHRYYSASFHPAVAGLQRYYAAIRLPEGHLPSSLIRLVGHTRSVMTGVSWYEQEPQGLTGCLDDIMCSASGRATPGLLSQLARTRREILPSSMHTPWAGSNRYKISELMSFTAERPLPVDSPSLPFCVRFNEALRDVARLRLHAPYRLAATLDTEPLAKSYSGGSRTRLSSNHFQSARSPLCSHLRSCERLMIPNRSVNVAFRLIHIGPTREYLAPFLVPYRSRICRRRSVCYPEIQGTEPTTNRPRDAEQHGYRSTRQFLATNRL